MKNLVSGDEITWNQGYTYKLESCVQDNISGGYVYPSADRRSMEVVFSLTCREELLFF